MSRELLLMFLLAALPPVAQQTTAPIISPEVQPDGRATFRLRAPNAREVFLALEGNPRIAMQEDDRGVWSVAAGPLEPDFYGYSFIADGVSLIDPSNYRMKPNLLNPQSLVHVPGPLTLTWETNDVPHGVLHRHFYRSAVVGDDRDFIVYTPPGYSPSGKDDYPVLYLLHGFSDDTSAWTAVGRAHVILDNLIARGRAKPMIVVMPLGYGAPEVLSRSTGGPRNPSLWRRNVERFRDALLQEVLPLVEKSYRVSRDPKTRAIAGLSMGGAQSLHTGLNSLDRFAWVGAFSSGGLGDDFSTTFPSLEAKANAQLQLLWIACGKEDRLIEANRKFVDWLKGKGVQNTYLETPGGHAWLVWRRYLSDFVPLLFR